MKRVRREIELFQPDDRVAWRAWLERNHRTTSAVWLVLGKKQSSGPRIPYDAAVEEALCFGWVDSRTNKLDDERYKLLYTPRNPGSGWSSSNKERVQRLIAEHRMTQAGLDLIEGAKRDGSWSSLDDVEALRIPPDLQAALAESPTAQRFFEAFSASAKKIILLWILNAKRPDTRSRRVEETVRLAEQNIKAAHPR
jgi:uncharacterized protein YdeI (YjbR/CyaY-like superfamily)